MKRTFGTTALLLAGVAVLATMVVAGATASTAKKTANVQVCVLLPDTKSSVRWVQFDAPLLAKAFKAAGVSASINNALNDPQKQKAQADAVSGRGREGRHRGRHRPRLGCGDREVVHGKGVQGDRLRPPGQSAAPRPSTSRSTATRSDGLRPPASWPRSRASTKPVVAELWGGQTDSNAFWFKSGNDDILNPLFKSGKIKKGPQQFVPGWLATNAGPIFSQMLLKTNNKIDGAHRGERQHRRRGRRDAEGQAPAADPAQRAGRDRRRVRSTSSPAGRPERSTSPCPTRRKPPPRLRSRCSTASSRRRPRPG